MPMTEEQAWDLIDRQIKRDDGRLIRVVVSLFLIISGIVTIIFCVPAGLAVMAAGIVMMTVTAKHVSRKTIDIDDVYEKNILAKWLSEYFDDVKFGTKECLTVKDIKKLRAFGKSGCEININRSFLGTRKGIRLRACEVIAADEPKNALRTSRIDYAEPEYSFWGRLFVLFCEDEKRLHDAEEEMKSRGMDCFYSEGKLYFAQNLYSETGPYPVWFPAPDKDNRGPEKIHGEVRRQIEPYMIN